MTDAQWLLLLVALIYVSDCVVWLRHGMAAVVIPIAGRPFVRLPSTWAGNERGGLAFTTLIPARAVFVCGGESFRFPKDRVPAVLRANRTLHALCVALFLALFAVAPPLAWHFGFAQIGLLLIAAFLLANVVVSLLFFRAHKRVDPADRTHRWVHAVVMFFATPSAIRAADQVTRHALRELDPLAAAAQLVGTDDAVVKRMLRELAHPPGPRYELARKAGLEHVEEPPLTDAAAYCPRCLAQYGSDRSQCADCEIPLLGVRRPEPPRRLAHQKRRLRPPHSYNAPMKFDADAARRIGEAVRELECRSAAELVVEVRARSGSYAHADARFAALLAIVSLAIILFMPWTVPPITVLLDPIAFYVAGLGIARWTPAVRRLFTLPRTRQEAVRMHAAALFHDRGIAGTSAETGLLLYVSLLERRMEVLADRGLLRKVNANDWNAALAELHRERALDPDAVIAAIHTLEGVLERDLPASPDNADELSNAPEIRLA